MSNRISWTWRHAIGNSDLPFTTKGVLWAISHFMNEAGQGAYPTTQQLSSYCSLSERAICTHIQNASDAGWIRKKPHGFSGQKWKNHEYEAQWPSELGDGKGTERGSGSFDKALNLTTEGTERDDKKALNVVQSNVSYNIPYNIPLKEEAQAPSKKGKRLPADWQPSQADRELATSLNVDPEKELEKFHDYWIGIPGSKGCKLDWAATWRNWVRRASPSQRGVDRPRRKTNSEKMVEALARAAAE